MNIEQAQQETRSIYLNGYPGAIVSGLLWIGSASIGTWSSPKTAMWFLVLGGMFIFPCTQLALRLSGRPASLSEANPLRYLAMQIAFTIPLTMPLAGVAALYHASWFYPAMLLIVGAHYLPFVFLYGMRAYAALCGVMVAAGLAIALYVPHAFSLGGWAGGAIEIAFGTVGLALSAVRRPSPSPA